MEDLQKILKIVSSYHNLDPMIITSKIRKREIVQPRQIGMYFAKKFTKHSLRMIGEYFGGFDHATVKHSEKTVANLRETDRFYANEIEEMERAIKCDLLQKDQRTITATLTLKDSQLAGKWWYSFKGKTHMSDHKVCSVPCSSMTDILSGFVMSELERLDISIVIQPVVSVEYKAMNTPVEIQVPA